MPRSKHTLAFSSRRRLAASVLCAFVAAFSAIVPIAPDASIASIKQLASIAPLAAIISTGASNLPQFANWSCAAAESAPRGLQLSNFKVYTVRMDTRVIAPPSGLPCTEVRVWHALPTYRPWSEAKSPVGTLDYYADPAAVVEPEDDHRSTHILFDAKKGQLPGIEKHYISQFRVISPDRKLDPANCNVSWNDVLRYNSLNKISFSKGNNEVALLANKLRSNKSPVETVAEFCRWIRENIRYDSTCSIDGNDFSAILSKKRGHCWHYMSLLRALCSASGLQARPAEGMNLIFGNGIAPADRSRLDYVNGHVWAEVFFPGLGWIEVEPNSDHCFNIPSTYVQNNTKFQNYAVWITEQGQMSREPKAFVNGSEYINEYGVLHKITFSEKNR